jgi:cytochrome c-type biogenesis protein CcmE
MNRIVKIALTICLVLGSVGYLLAASLGDNLEYYKHVDEVVAAPDQYGDKRLKVNGKVVAGSILKRRGALDYKFQVEHNGATLPVTYTGLVPDTFVDGAEVVVAGRLHDGVLRGDEVIAKCPSKYEAKGELHPEGIPMGPAAQAP